MKLFISLSALAMTAQPLTAHPGEQLTPLSQPRTAPTSDEAAVRAVLSQYKSAIERLDATETERLFTAESTVFETGGVEGSYANYLAKHLGPELGHFKSFKFSDYKVEVHLLSADAAHAIETYKFRIETKAGEVVDRLGVATSVLRKENGTWKIVMMHSSSRRPKAS